MRRVRKLSYPGKLAPRYAPLRARPVGGERVLVEVDAALHVGDRGDHGGAEAAGAVEDGGGADRDAVGRDPVQGGQADLDALRVAGEGQGDVGVDVLDAVAAPVRDHAGRVGDAGGGHEAGGRLVGQDGDGHLPGRLVPGVLVLAEGVRPAGAVAGEQRHVRVVGRWRDVGRGRLR